MTITFEDLLNISIKVNVKASRAESKKLLESERHELFMKANAPYCVQHTILIITDKNGKILHKYTLSKYFVYKHEEVVCGGYLLPADSWFAGYDEEVANSEATPVREIFRETEVVEEI